MKLDAIKKLRFWGPDADDPLRNRRELAFLCAIFSLIIWPHELILLHWLFGLEADLIKALLVYVGTVAGTSIGGYIWSSIKEDEGKQNAGLDNKKSNS